MVANRLSESGRHSVLVLEAGGSDRTFNIRVPIGYGRSFTDPKVNWMYEAQGGIRLLRRLAATRPLADVIAGELLPGSDAQTDDALLHDFRQRSGTVYHPTCTCRMGPDPRTSAVDARPRVRPPGIDDAHRD